MEGVTHDTRQYRSGLRLLGRVGASVVDLALPRTCGGCGALGVKWCVECDAEVAGRITTRASGLLGPTGRPPGFPITWSAATYEGPLRKALVAYKDQDRRDLRPILARLLSWALMSASAAVRDHPGRSLDDGGIDGDERERPLTVVPIPSTPRSRRERGDDPLRDLVACAIRGTSGVGTPPHVTPALRMHRRIHDQVGLTRRQRITNLTGAMSVDPGFSERLGGQVVVLADDVVTTGATLSEAARVLRGAGCRRVVAATVANAPNGVPPAAGEPPDATWAGAPPPGPVNRRGNTGHRSPAHVSHRG